MKQLVYLCGEYPRATDTFIQREVAGLRMAGFHVETISVRHPSVREQGSKEQAREKQNTYYLLPCSLLRLARNHLGLLFQSPARYFGALKCAIKVRAPGLRSFLYQLFYFAEAGLVVGRMRKRSLSHIHSHAPDSSGFVAMIAARMGGFTYSMTLHGFGIFSEPNRWRLKEKIEASLFTICISQHGKSQAMLWSGRACWDKLHIVHCGVDTGREEIRNHEGRGRNLLFIGRLDHVKGLPLLIEAVSVLKSNYPDIHLDIVGDGPERADLQSIIDSRQLEKEITIHGYRSQKELQAFFQRADLFVMTSFFEGIPVVLMEAMAHGVPVVAPRITGIPELVEDGVCGFLTIPGDSGALAESIASLLNDPGKRNRFASAGRRKVETDFDLNNEIKRLAGIMRSYLG